MSRYNNYTQYLKNKYGERVYKIPINLPVTCPNRDGVAATGGCIFCGDVGAGFEAPCNTLTVKDQLDSNIERMSQRIKSKKFIAYFQNFTNTYMHPDQFETWINEVDREDVVGISVSTRPDCIHDLYLDILEDAARRNNWDVSIELGLQTINPHTLKAINRGHGLAQWIDAVNRVKARGFDICTHLILNLPWDTDLDTDEAARLITAMGVGHVKLHSLYILKNTQLGDMYTNGEIEMISPEDYVERVVRFIRLVGPDVVFQRVAGRAPEKDTLFCNWNMSWWRIRDAIDKRLEDLDAVQGDQCDYLNGVAVRHFTDPLTKI